MQPGQVSHAAPHALPTQASRGEHVNVASAHWSCASHAVPEVGEAQASPQAFPTQAGDGGSGGQAPGGGGYPRTQAAR